MWKKVLTALLMVSIMLSMLVGCGAANEADTGTPADTSAKAKPEQEGSPEQASGENSFAKTVDFSVASLMVTSGANFEDAMYQELNKRFNFTMKVVPLTWDDYQQKPRIWLASGDAPDVFTWDFNYTDYKNYIEQQLIEPLPDGYAEKYPDLANAFYKTSLTKFLENKQGGKLYCVPHVAYMDPPSNPVVAHQVLYYRKDWVSKVGASLGTSATLDEIFDIARKFVSEDPGNNGKGNTIGLISRSDFLNDMIIASYNKNYNTFHNENGTFLWGPASSATLDGLKYFRKVYDEGLIYKDYYTFKGKEFYDKFYAGQAGMMFGEGHGNEQRIIRNEFQTTNPGMNPNDAVGICVVLANDGKWRGEEKPNFWTASLFKKGIAKEKQDRILAIMNYLSSKEGYDFVRLGVEGKDYKKENGKVVITREKDPKTGNPVDIMDVYPSQRVWVFHSVLDDQWGISNPELSDEARSEVINTFKLKEEKGDIRHINWDINLFTAPNYDKFKLNFADEYASIIAKEGDVEKNWNEWVAKNKAMVDAVLKEMMEGINN